MKIAVVQDVTPCNLLDIEEVSEELDASFLMIGRKLGMENSTDIRRQTVGPEPKRSNRSKKNDAENISP
jgi:hypothetical protein